METSQSSQVHLQTLLQDFYVITQISITFTAIISSADDLRNQHYSYPQNDESGFMSQLKLIPELSEKIMASEAEAILRVTENHEPFCYFEPFPGLISFVFSVYSRGVQLGYFVIGPFRTLQEHSHYHQIQRTEIYRANHMDNARMTELYNQIPSMTNDALLAARRLLSLAVEYSYGYDINTAVAPSLADRIAGYIDSQYMNPISHHTACTFFHISSSTLNRSLVRAFGMTFQVMLNKRRIHNVCECLQNGLSPEQASALSGFSSAVYMARVFTPLIGCTPSVYRQSITKNRNTFHFSSTISQQ